MKSAPDTEKIKAFIEGKFPSSTEVGIFVCQLWETFQKHNLQDSDFVTEFTSGKHNRLLQRYTEMLFSWYFIKLGFLPTSQDEGPDLCIDHNGTRIWIEIITPELLPPSGNGTDTQKASKEIKDYLAPLPTDPKAMRVIDVPTKQILLRWTAALKEKKEKLTGKKNKNNHLGYIEKCIVKPGDIYVVAINSVLLGRCGFIGISQYPYPVEATFAVGSIQVSINQKTSEVAHSEPSYRPHILNHNQSSIPADSFLNPNYKEVSALIATHVGLEAAFQPCPPSPLVLVHNPYAVNSLPKRIFKPEEEYIAEDNGKFWAITNIVGS
jgi:type I restriction enzyme S subunit